MVSRSPIFEHHFGFPNPTIISEHTLMEHLKGSGMLGNKNEVMYSLGHTHGTECKLGSAKRERLCTASSPRPPLTEYPPLSKLRTWLRRRQRRSKIIHQVSSLEYSKNRRDSHLRVNIVSENIPCVPISLSEARCYLSRIHHAR
jgi:hypothetical protein